MAPIPSVKFVKSPGETSLPPQTTSQRTEQKGHDAPFRVEPTCVPIGSHQTVSATWRLKQKIPPRYGWIGVFPEDGPLQAELAVTRVDGLACRQSRGRVDAISVPDRLGVYRVALFTAIHHGALPVSPEYVAEVRVTLPTLGASKSGAEASLEATRLLSQTQVARSPVHRTISVSCKVSPGWIPYDTRHSQRERVEGKIRRREVVRTSSTSPTRQEGSRGNKSPPKAITPSPVPHSRRSSSPSKRVLKYVVDRGSPEDAAKAQKKFQRRILSPVQRLRHVESVIVVKNATPTLT